jgi:hypothetical protein
MTTFGFGQRAGQVIQTAYVVPDIRAAIAWWTRDARVGPWFLLESFNDPNGQYRGAPSTADISLAMAFAGHMMIELIQPRDDRPSVYRETIDHRGFGFHHIGIAFEDVEAAREDYLRRGYEVAFSTPVPSGGNVYYMAGTDPAPGFVELIPATPGMDELFTRYWRASVDWDGRDPIRPFG